ncbi:MAG: FadR family transcriptional regulator [Sphingomonadales bacterium]|nr:FadR family transcriptional regulator [Sphingomonadales bacterium]
MSLALPVAPQGSLVDQAIARIREHIRGNDLKVGDPLPGEGRFATEFGVSRAVMREAFGALAALHQIDVGNGRRARVAALDGAVMAASIDHGVATAQITVADVWDVRRVLELRVVELAARHRSDADAQAISAAAEAMLAAGPDLAALTAADVGFHHAIARASGNPLFHQIVRSFGTLMDEAVPRAWRTRRTEAQRSRILDIHHGIALAIARRDAAAAVAAMDLHFDTSIGDMMREAAP